MTRVFFNPWIGKNFNAKGFSGKKILIVGDSHLCNDCPECGDLSIKDKDCRGLTTKAVETFLKYKNKEINHVP